MAGGGLEALASRFEQFNPEALILKENRGGSRLYIYSRKETIGIGACLADTTVNSVGVGDVYDAIYLVNRERGLSEAAWRATWASSAYAQTTEPDTFFDSVRRTDILTYSELEDLGGIHLPWDARPNLNIYLAAPDFGGADTRQIERALSALQYHNFNVRRPVKENGELPPGSELATLRNTYRKDLALLSACDLVFAIPTNRDPGTLVEIGLAISMRIPVCVSCV